jgi:cytoskeletal protein RodZ
VLAASVPEGDGPTPGATAAASVGRPGRPLLAGAAVLGALLIAVPGLLMSRDRTPESHDRVVADQAGTILGDGAPTQGAGAYASDSPSAPAPHTTSKATPHHTAPAKSTVGQPVSEPTTIRKTTKPVATPKPKKTTTKSGSKSTTTTKSTYPSDILVTATRVLNSGQSLNAKKARLRMQSDGNFVLYDENNKARWATNTFGSNFHAVFQADGNLVVYTSSNQAVWASQTEGHNGAILRLQGDGNLVIYSGSTPIWASNTQH